MSWWDTHGGKDAFNAYMREWRIKNPDKERINQKNRDLRWKKQGKLRSARRKYHLKKYGLTPDEYQAKLDAQGGVCAICHRPETIIMRGSTKSLDVDHNHQTNAIRGLLCSACNAALGLLQEDLLRIESMLRYLQEWNG